jgi:hypothetical protein
LKGAKSTTKSIKSYALVNSLHMYYEIPGEDRPLILLHGDFSTLIPHLERYAYGGEEKVMEA